MRAQLVTVSNVKDIKFDTLVDLLHDIYTKEVPETDLTTPTNMEVLEHLTSFFSNQYAYITELWAVMESDVRVLKRASANKDAIDESMSKRDFLEKVMGAIKLKYYSASRLFKYVADEKYG